jgi:hypothetical protein
VKFLYTATTTGLVDVWFTDVQGNASSYIYGAIYGGSFPNTTAPPASPCDGNALAWYQDDSTAIAFLPQIAVVAGQNYTIVVSSDTDDTWVFMGVFVKPTIFGSSGDSDTNYVAPVIPALDITQDCTSSGTSKQWAAQTLVGQGFVTIVDVGSYNALHSSPADLASVVYRGNNSQNPPVTCSGLGVSFLIAGDSGDGGPLGFISRNNTLYTIIVTGYSSGAGPYALWVLTGANITALNSTDAGTTGVVSTTQSGSTTANPASTTDMPTTGSSEDEDSESDSSVEFLKAPLTFVAVVALLVASAIVN